LIIAFAMIKPLPSMPSQVRAFVDLLVRDAA
jgi:hypothetical protein